MTNLPRPRDRSREFDIVLWGATGYTGQLVAEYLVRNYLHGDTGLRLALAGRNEEKVRRVAVDVGEAELPILLGDSFDGASLDAIASRAEVVITTVGPYAKYGAELVAATGTAGLEGVMAKRLGSTYVPGKRSPNWRKIKHRRAIEVVIGGVTAGEGNRASTFGISLSPGPCPQAIWGINTSVKA